MKQAFTNTGRNPSQPTVAGAAASKASRSAGRRKQQMPLCDYGSGCTRRGCVYRHPDKKQEVYAEVCKPFLAGICQYGRNCYNIHPGADEAESLRIKYASTTCRWGDDCRSEGCLYSHPSDRANIEDGASHAELSYGLHFGSECIPVDQAAILEPRGVENLPLYPSGIDSDMQRLWQQQQQQQQQYTDWQPPHSSVEGVDLPKLTERLDLSASSPGPNAGLTGCARAPLPQVSAGVSSQLCLPSACPSVPDEWTPNSAAEWVPNGAAAEWMPNGAAAEWVPNGAAAEWAAYRASTAARPPDPPPATNRDPSPSSLSARPHFITAATAPPSVAPLSKPPAPGSWAAIAAAHGAAAPPASMAGATCAAHFGGGARGSGGGGERRAVRIPSQLWLVDVSRLDAATAFSISDPLARFSAVNAPHEARTADQALPSTLQAATIGGHRATVGVMDLHYQSVRTAALVLDTVLPELLHVHSEVWVITGTGHHTDKASHQRSVAGGVLHATVQDYLTRGGFTFHPGRDAAGHSGAFLVVD